MNQIQGFWGFFFLKIRVFLSWHNCPKHHCGKTLHKVEKIDFCCTGEKLKSGRFQRQRFRSVWNVEPDERPSPKMSPLTFRRGAQHSLSFSNECQKMLTELFLQLPHSCGTSDQTVPEVPVHAALVEGWSLLTSRALLQKVSVIAVLKSGCLIQSNNK